MSANNTLIFELLKRRDDDGVAKLWKAPSSVEDYPRDELGRTRTPFDASNK